MGHLLFQNTFPKASAAYSLRLLLDPRTSLYNLHTYHISNVKVVSRYRKYKKCSKTKNRNLLGYYQRRYCNCNNKRNHFLRTFSSLIAILPDYYTNETDSLKNSRKTNFVKSWKYKK